MIYERDDLHGKRIDEVRRRDEDGDEEGEGGQLIGERGLDGIRFGSRGEHGGLEVVG